MSAGRWAGTWGPSASRRVPGSSGVLPGMVGRPPCRLRASIGGAGRRARPGRGGRPGRLRRPGASGRPSGRRPGRWRRGWLAARTGRAIGARLGAVALVVGGDIQREQGRFWPRRPQRMTDRDLRAGPGRRGFGRRDWAGRDRCRRGRPGGLRRSGRGRRSGDGLAGVLAVVLVVAVAFQDVEDLGGSGSMSMRSSLVMCGSSCGGGGRAGGCRGRCRCRWRVSSRSGAGSRGVELVVVQGGGGAPVPGDGAAAGEGGGAAFGAGAYRGALVPPGVVQVGDRIAQLRADGEAAATRARSHGATPAARAMRAGPGPSRAEPAAGAGCRRRPAGRGAGPGW